MKRWSMKIIGIVLQLCSRWCSCISAITCSSSTSRQENLAPDLESRVLALEQKEQYYPPKTTILASLFKLIHKSANYIINEDYLPIFREPSLLVQESSPLNLNQDIILAQAIKQMLLIKNTQTLSLQRPALKILRLCTALNGFLFVTTTEQTVERLVHVDKEGKTLWERDYVDSVDTFGMFNEREAIVLNVNEDKIEVIDLLKHEVRAFPHTFTYQDTAGMDILVFNDSKLFCVVERGTAGDHRLFLTYYAYDAELRQVAAYKSGEGEWIYGMPVAQGNNHSKVIWWSPKHDSTVEFHTYCLKVDPQGIHAVVKVNNTLGAEYKVNNFILEIASVWETTPHVYMLVCNTNRTGDNDSPPNNNYILDARKEIIRETKFSFPQRHNKQIMDYFNLGEVSAFHTFRFDKQNKNGGAVPSPVYYVNNEREEIIATEEWTCTNKTHFYIPGFDASTIIQADHENGDVSEVSITTKRLMTPKEMYLHFMLHIHEDFDDDLLQDAVELLTE